MADLHCALKLSVLLKKKNLTTAHKLRQDLVLTVHFDEENSKQYSSDMRTFVPAEFFLVTIRSSLMYQKTIQTDSSSKWVFMVAITETVVKKNIKKPNKVISYSGKRGIYFKIYMKCVCMCKSKVCCIFMQPVLMWSSGKQVVQKK